MKVQCNFCGHDEAVERTVQYIYRRDNKFLVVNDVPCEECTRCGERYYDIKVLKSIEAEFEALHNGSKKAKKEVRVPIEGFAEIAS